MIDFYASQPHYLDHLAPVWLHLPESHRGTFFVGNGAAARAVEQWVMATTGKPAGNPAVVAGYSDLVTVRNRVPSVAYMEHGAGFSFGGDQRSARHNSYAGGPDRKGVGLFLVPGPHPAQRNRAAHPRIPVVEVGCPKLDWWHRLSAIAPKERDAIPTVAITWHWDCQLAPETRSAWKHFAPALTGLAADPRWRLVGHSHPRWGKAITRAYEELGIPVVDDFFDVLKRADVLVADATSAIYEFASLNRPVVLMNAPWYRRDVRHGLRFWDAAGVGVSCDDPALLRDAVATAAFDDNAERRGQRLLDVSRVYTHIDGGASQRAADALVAWCDALDSKEDARD